MRNPYQTRVVKQTILWVNGVSRHNHVDGECTPDFSCCVPHMFTEDLAERQEYLTKYLAKESRIRGEQELL